MAVENKFADEMLTDDELDHVAGGNRDELALDVKLFNAMNGRTESFDIYKINSVKGIAERVSWLYGKLGIRAQYNDSGANRYFNKNNQQISRNDAVVEALNKAGYHDMDPKQFQI